MGVGGVMNVIFLPTIFVRLYLFPSHLPPCFFFLSCFYFRRRKPKLCFAIKKKLQECVSSELTLCTSDCMGWREGACGSPPPEPICPPEKLHSIFSDREKKERKKKLTFNLRGQEGRRGRRRKKERGQCGLCLELMFSGERSNQ